MFVASSRCKHQHYPDTTRIRYRSVAQPGIMDLKKHPTLNCPKKAKKLPSLGSLKFKIFYFRE